MKPQILLFSLLFLTWTSAVRADQVNLKNGDRITGKIQKKDGASLVMKSDIFGVVTIPWDAITRLISDEPLTVVLPDGKSVQGKIAAENNSIQVTTQAAQETIPASQVGAIRNADEQKAFERLQNPRLMDLWTGVADFGVSFARGNAVTDTITTAFKASRETRTDKIGLYFTQIYAKGKQANGTTAITAEAIRGGWSYNRRFDGGRLFVNTFNDYEYDAFQDLDLRFVIGGGLGYQLIKRETMELNLAAGISYNREKFSTPLVRNSAEAYWGDGFTYRFSKSTTLTQTFKMFNNLSNTGEYRINFDTGIGMSLRRWLSWQLTFSDRYLSDPLPGFKSNDMLFTTGVRLVFAR